MVYSAPRLLEDSITFKKELADKASDLAFIEGMLQIPIYSSYTALANATIPSYVTTIQVAGHTNPGDGGSATYTRVNINPKLGPASIQSQDGSWWQYVVSGSINLLQMGGVADGSTSNYTPFNTLFGLGNCVVPYAKNVYVLDQPLTLPAGIKLSHQDSPTILYTGLAPTTNTFILNLGGNGVKIRPIGESVLSIVAQNPSGYLYAVGGISVSDCEVSGVLARNCSHVFFTSNASATYGSVNDTNACFRNKVIGGGAVFDNNSYSTAAQGACYMGYSYDWTVRDSVYNNCYHGIEWWGGNPQTDGAIGNPRKNGRFLINNVKVYNAQLAGIWGTMAKDSRIIGCYVDKCGDVGINTEASVNLTVSTCEVKDCVNGNYTTFFLCDTTLFDNCISVHNTAYRYHLDVYNTSQSQDNASLIWRGGSTIGNGVITSMGTSHGPVRNLVIDCDAMVNTLINAVATNNHMVRIRGKQEWTIPVLIGTSLVNVGGITGAFPAIPSIDIEVTQSSLVIQPEDCLGIQVSSANAADCAVSVHNCLTTVVTQANGNPGAPISYNWSGPNANSSATFSFVGNTGYTRIIKNDTGASPAHVTAFANSDRFGNVVTPA